MSWKNTCLYPVSAPEVPVCSFAYRHFNFFRIRKPTLKPTTDNRFNKFLNFSRSRKYSPNSPL